MNEKKVLEMNNDDLHHVTGGQADTPSSYETNMTPADLPTNFEDPNVIYLSCPECGGSLDIFAFKSNQYSTITTTVCPHCHKKVSITV